MHSLRLVEQGGLSCKESFIGLLRRGRHMVVLVVEWMQRVKIGVSYCLTTTQGPTASEHDCLEPDLQRFNNPNSSDDLMNTPSKEDLDNLFEVSPSTSSIIVDTHEAPPVVTTSDEQTSPISLQESDEFNQEDSTDVDGNTQFVPYDSLKHEEIKSSTTNLEP
ncbi:hypothetical protein Tco_1029129 [Tanacetum coccineum]|uniref:Uncharacterized protein n=1 Tax=Tanacetum coccineum TaxID=301880 RepID=A0ABQ5G3U1_9ASTR